MPERCSPPPPESAKGAGRAGPGSRYGERRAQALVEAALVTPLLLLLLIGVVDLGRAFYYETIMAAAVREGARVAADRTASTSRIIAAVRNAAPDISSSTNFVCCTITPATRASGQTVAVSATWNLSLLTPGAQTLLAPLLVTVGGNAYLPLTQTARMVVF